MNTWEILGIDVTDNPAYIRRAYADQLKIHHPQDDPEGFQRLRQAYEQALKYSKIRAMIAAGTKSTGENDKSEEPDKTKDQIETQKNESEESGESIPFFPLVHWTEPAIQNPYNASSRGVGIEEFLNSASELYNDFYARIKIEDWEKVLQDDQLWDMNLKEKVRWEVLRFFVIHPDLPQSVWLRLDSEFHWSDISTPLSKAHRQDMIILQRETDPQWDMSFSQFHNAGEFEGEFEDQRTAQIDFSLYAQCRRNVRNAIIDNDYAKSRDCYFQAVLIFENDPDIYRIYFEYLRRKLSEEKTLPEKDLPLTIINRLIKFFPDDPIYLLKRANLCLKLGFYDTAICDYTTLLVIYPDNLEIPFYLADAYRKIGKLGKKIQCYGQICKKYTKTQKRLKLHGDGTMDSLKARKQMQANEHVLAQIKNMSTFTTLENIVFGSSFLIVLLILYEAYNYFAHIFIAFIFYMQSKILSLIWNWIVSIIRNIF